MGTDMVALHILLARSIRSGGEAAGWCGTRGRSRQPMPGRRATGAFVILALGLAALPSAWSQPGGQQPPRRERADVAADDVTEDRDDGLSLPNDRDKERQLDRVQRLVADARWSDAAVILDELLGGDRDAFLRADEQDPTRRSVRAAATAIIARLPKPGREAYQLLFRGRAERGLREAIASDDAEGMVSVARRWFDTPAGRAAAIATAVRAIEDGQPLLAAAWLDRLAAAEVRDERLESTVVVMRSLARHLAGDPAAADLVEKRGSSSRGTVVVAGREVPVSVGPGRGLEWLTGIANLAREPARHQPAWLEPGGDPARNALGQAERPLMVPRYRVPLVRHPQEGEVLENCRRALVDRDTPAVPAGLPLAVAGQVIVRSSLGIMGIDFESGKRLWIQAASFPSGGAVQARGDDDRAAGAMLAFDDATAGELSSNGSLVYAVESPPAAMRSPTPANNAVFPGNPSPGGGWSGGNTLSAYDARAQGEVRWRLPTGPAGEASPTWFMGAPLVAGGDLHLVCEEKGEIRLEVRDAALGSLKWMQPLAELDERRRISEPTSRPRRLAGLSPSLGSGVLVCPLGGCIVAVDTTTRSLLWAHTYATSGEATAAEAPIRGRRQQTPVETRAAGMRCRDSRVVISGDRLLLAPRDSDELICLDLFTGNPAWQTFPRGVLHVAGVVDDRVITVEPRAVEALSLRTGRRIWRRDFGDDAATPSGRGLLTPKRLFLPLDTPEVLEISIDDGMIVARCPARGDAVPGNLVAYRGEWISRSADSLAVFHQVPVLESRVETAQRTRAVDPWALRWAGELAIDCGDVAGGLARLRQAANLAPLPPGALAEAAVFGMRRDFTAAAATWRESVGNGPLPAAARDAIRLAVDGFMQAGDLDTAWDACRAALPGDATASRALSVDPADPRLSATDEAWLRGRVVELVARAPGALRQRIDDDLTGMLEAARALPEPTRRQALERLALRLHSHPVAGQARRELDATTTKGRDDVRRDLTLLAQAKMDDPDLRTQAQRTIAAILAPPGTLTDSEAVWPLGRVVQRRSREERESTRSRARLLPLHLEDDHDSFLPGTSLAFDPQQGRLHVLDARGGQAVEPIPCEPAAARLGLPWLPQSSGFQAAFLGRTLIVRMGETVSAYDMTVANPGGRCLWSRTDRAGRGAEAVPPWGQRTIAARMPPAGEPLGALLPAPDEPIVAAAIRGGRPRITGVPCPAGTGLSVLDPGTGDVLWERRRLPAAAQLIGDDDMLCVCPPDGRASLVLSMLDGRLLQTCDVPPRHRRLATWGRRIVAVESAAGDEGPAIVPRVRLVLHDPAAASGTVLGEFSGAARAALAAAGELAILEPSGDLSLFDIGRGAAVVRTRLPDMPRPFQHLRVMPWRDRYLVFAAGADAAADDRLGQVSPLQQAMIADDPSPPSSGAIWAVDRSTGELLWPAAATVEAHCLHSAQPADLPVLVFCRQIQPRHDAERLLLSVLCLDKRTGHAVFEDDRIPAQPHLLFGIDVVGDPGRHAIELREIGAAGRVINLVYDGGPMPPQPPHQRSVRPGPDPGSSGR